jgi:hypothetical protein
MYAALDLHKMYSQAVVLEGDGTVTKEERIENSTESLDKLERVLRSSGAWADCKDRWPEAKSTFLEKVSAQDLRSSEAGAQAPRLVRKEPDGEGQRVPEGLESKISTTTTGARSMAATWST